MPNNQKFFIILCTYNPSLNFFKALVNSLRAQTYTHWQCLLLDDASAEPIYQEICDIVGVDAQFSMHRNVSNLGVVANFEQGLSWVPDDCDLVAYCDQDDIWLPNKLALMLPYFADPEVMLCHSDMQLIDEHDAVISESCFAYEKRDVGVNDYSLRQLILRNSVTGCASVFRRSLVAKILPFARQNPADVAYYHDLWTALHAVIHGRIVTICQPLVQYRQHSQNILGASFLPRDSVFSFLRKLLVGKIQFYPKVFFIRLWQDRQQLIQDFLYAIRHEKLSLHQQKEVVWLMKWGDLRATSFSILVFSCQQLRLKFYTGRNGFGLLIGKWWQKWDVMLARLKNERSYHG